VSGYLASLRCVSTSSPYCGTKKALALSCYLAAEGGSAPGGSSPISCVQKTGTYKLLFCVLQEEPEELECVYAEILDPVVTSNSYYGNELVSTLTTYLGNDASTAKTAAGLFAHRHTIRYHLDHSRS
jgi:PucR family transcriptional regulator, purine catabolism regulatory protein